MLELFINLGMVDKNSLLVQILGSETINPSPGDVCDCLGLHQAILSQVWLQVLTFSGTDGITAFGDWADNCQGKVARLPVSAGEGPRQGRHR